MATHYILDGNTAVLANSRILDSRMASDGQTLVNGNFVVKVGDDIKIAGAPKNLSELLTMKYQGTLAANPMFSHITYDDMLDPDGVSLANSSLVRMGYRGCNGFIPNSNGTQGALKTVGVSVSPAVPSQGMLIYDAFRYVIQNPKSGKMTRVYQEADVDLDVIIYAGSKVAATLPGYINGSLISLSGFVLGDALSIRFAYSGTNPANQPLYLGSWAFLY